MVISRYAFGYAFTSFDGHLDMLIPFFRYYGVLLCCLLNLIGMCGFSILNCILGGQALASVSNQNLSWTYVLHSATESGVVHCIHWDCFFSVLVLWSLGFRDSLYPFVDMLHSTGMKEPLGSLYLSLSQLHSGREANILESLPSNPPPHEVSSALHPPSLDLPSPGHLSVPIIPHISRRMSKGQCRILEFDEIVLTYLFDSWKIFVWTYLGFTLSTVTSSFHLPKFWILTSLPPNNIFSDTSSMYRSSCDCFRDLRAVVGAIIH